MDFERTHSEQCWGPTVHINQMKLLKISSIKNNAGNFFSKNDGYENYSLNKGMNMYNIYSFTPV